MIRLSRQVSYNLLFRGMVWEEAGVFLMWQKWKERNAGWLRTRFRLWLLCSVHVLYQVAQVSSPLCVRWTLSMMRLLQGQRWRSGGPGSWLWRATRAATTSSTFSEWGAALPAVFYRWAGKLAGWPKSFHFLSFSPDQLKQLFINILFVCLFFLIQVQVCAESLVDGVFCFSVTLFIALQFWHAVTIPYMPDRLCLASVISSHYDCWVFLCSHIWC